MQVWQFEEAQEKFTQLIECANNEPQIISRNGLNEVIVTSLKHYELLTKEKESFLSPFSKLSLLKLDFEFEREKSLPRDVDFFDDEED